MSDGASARVDGLDLELFCSIPSETSVADRRSLLALQSAVARTLGTYTYLEIGSHLGGSIQPHLLDPRCKRIYSIDARPAAQPDERGVMFHYPENSTHRMLANLRAIGGDLVSKVRTHDSGVSGVPSSFIEEPPSLCFIDGEHTREAALMDFAFCERVTREGAVICFHDANILSAALKLVFADLRSRSRSCEIVKLGGTVLAIGLGRSSAALNDPSLSNLKQSVRKYFCIVSIRSLLTRLLGDRVIDRFRPLMGPLVRRLQRH